MSAGPSVQLLRPPHAWDGPACVDLCINSRHRYRIYQPCAKRTPCDYNFPQLIFTISVSLRYKQRIMRKATVEELSMSLIGLTFDRWKKILASSETFHSQPIWKPEPVESIGPHCNANSVIEAYLIWEGRHQYGILYSMTAFVNNMNVSGNVPRFFLCFVIAFRSKP